MANASVERFRKLTEELKQQVRHDAIAELNRQAGILESAIESVAPVYQGEPVGDVQPGALKTSVRIVPDKQFLTIVRVVAGGPTTMRGGRSYDYARAVEFGTQEMDPKPFFFPTYRLMRKKIRSSMRRKITATVKKYSAPP